jgi:hypothetical protein
MIMEKLVYLFHEGNGNMKENDAYWLTSALWFHHFNTSM